MSERRPRLNVRAFLCGALAAGFIASAAAAATFVVNSTGDQPDDNTADNVCHTAVGTCTLRAAIQQANATAGADTIQFAIAGGGVHTIQPASSLPSITDPITIDGYSQAGSSVNTLVVGDNAVLLIEIDGSLIGTIANGLTIFTNACTIKGLVINRFTNPGIAIDATGGGTSGGHSIQGNFIGTTPDGMTAAGNSGFGVFVRSPSNLIGGASPADRNVIAATGGSSNPFVSNLAFEADFGASIMGNVAQGNYIGTNAAGTAALSSANGAYGVVVHSGTAGEGHVFVGGGSAGAGNVIAGNTFFGVEIMSNPCTVTTTSVVVAGNAIGTDAAGGPLGNGYGGVHLGCGARDNTIGGFGGANVIANNGGGSFTGGGVLVDGSQTVPTGNAILGNSIYSNTKLAGGAVHAGLGIDLNSDGPTPNDPGDADTGPNHLQNYPVLTSVFSGPSSVTIQGTLNSTPSTTFLIELFESPFCDGFGFGEGKTFLGSTNVTTDAAGNGTFSAVFPAAIPVGSAVTATATDLNANDTSEFSACFAAQAPFTFFTVPPCRIIDTRGPAGAYGAPALANGAARDFVLAGQCLLPAGARAVSVNIAVTGATNGPGFLTIYPGGAARPLASTMNYKAGQTRANNAIVGLGASGDVLVFAGQGAGTVQLILDVDGYFQ